MFRTIVVCAILLQAALAFTPSSARLLGHQLQMKIADDMTSQMKKALGVATLGFALAGPSIPSAHADGAVSKSTVYRTRNNYGAKIMGLEKRVAQGDTSVFDKKVSNWFDLFISGANSLPGETNKIAKQKETALKADMFSAAAAGDSGKMKAAYIEFIKVADLKSEYKPGELGQTDSTGYSPTWGTDRQYIYQR
jgi:hypothetical protein